MSMSNVKLIVAVATISALAGFARAEEGHAHGDVLPYLSGGGLATDAFIDATGERVPNVRVFGLEFGEDALQPFFIGDPGFNAIGGSLPPGHRAGFQLVGNLLFWDGGGTGDPDFQPAPAGQSLRLNFGSASLDRTADGTSHNATPRFFGPAVAGNGSFHEHLNSELTGVDATTPTGFYRLDVQILTDADGVADPGTETSPTVFFIYNNGGDEELHEAAMEFVRDTEAPGTNLVPEPTCLAPLALAGAMLIRRRR